MHMYGYELWNLNDKKIEAFRIAWRRKYAEFGNYRQEPITLLFII